MSHDSRMRPSRMFVGVELSVEALRPGTSNFLTDLELGTTFSVPVARSSTWMEPIAEAVGLYFLVSLLHIPFVRSPSSSEVPGRSLASAEYFTFESISYVRSVSYISSTPTKFQGEKCPSLQIALRKKQRPKD